MPDFAALLALRRRTSPSVVLLRSVDHLTPDAQADLVLRAVTEIVDDLAAGAIASITPSGSARRRLPVLDG